MRIITIAACIVAVLGLTSLAEAQQGGGGATSTGQGQTGMPHRQPTAKDSPAEPARTDQPTSEADRKLDRVLKSICRGC